MDLTQSIEPRSDQQNADDMLAGPRTFTIESVTAGSAEQPIHVNLVEAPGKPYKPSKSMRRVLVSAWGAEGSAYAGRQLTLARDPHIKFGGIEVGGIIITHLSHIDKPLALALTVSRGKRSPFTVEPLVEASRSESIVQGDTKPSTEPTVDEVAACTDRGELKAMWKRSGTALRKVIEARVAELESVVPLVGGLVSSPSAEPPTGDDGTLTDGKW